MDIVDYAPRGRVPTRKADSLAFVVNELSGSQPSLVYANRPTDAEKIAQGLRRYGSSQQSGESIRRTILAIREYVHEDYSLTECLADGVGFHYSAMPDVARLAVEDLFESGELRYVACTSTLLEGVNFPAKNVFVSYPRQGRSTPMTDSAFWNLAGRAGRLLKEFAGNVYCVDQEKWERPVAERSRDYDLQSAFEVAVEEPSFVQYLTTTESVESKRAETFSNVVNSILLRSRTEDEGLLSGYLSQRIPSLGADRRSEVVEQITRIRSGLSLDMDIVARNRSIDARIQDEAFKGLMHMSREEIQAYVPVNPNDTERFFDRLASLFRFVAESLGVGTAARNRYIALLANRWIHENTLRAMIADQLDYARRDARSKGLTPELDIDDQIRTLIRDIEDQLRFTLVKGSKCAMDLIEHAFELRGWGKVPGLDQGLASYLELGMFRPATITLHNLGLSRTTAIVSANWARGRGVREDGIVRWLVANVQAADASLPRPSARELQKLLSSNVALPV